ncbi:MAG: HTTM domain-containing protein, partial [Dokdonia donghaensis]|nr:HTTM domain-containing protein [Dokdonia donghaensis]
MGINKLLFTRIDNSALIVFRVFFGFLITCEAWGALITGWVRRILVAPDFTFNFIGFDFLQTFPGPGPQMYAWFGLMGIF